MEKTIVESISRIAAQNLTEAIFGGKNGIGSIFQSLMGSSGQGGGMDWAGMFQSIFGSLFGGGAAGAGAASGWSGFGMFAKGTNFAPGGMALVGERGPELVNLPRGSRVTPNDKLGNTTNVFHVNVMPGATTASVRQTGDMLRDVVSRSVRSR
jgi:hypothetical protein